MSEYGSERRRNPQYKKLQQKQLHKKNSRCLKLIYRVMMTLLLLILGMMMSHIVTVVLIVIAVV